MHTAIPKYTVNAYSSLPSLLAYDIWHGHVHKWSLRWSLQRTNVAQGACTPALPCPHFVPPSQLGKPRRAAALGTDQPPIFDNLEFLFISTSHCIAASNIVTKHSPDWHTGAASFEADHLDNHLPPTKAKPSQWVGTGPSLPLPPPLLLLLLLPPLLRRFPCCRRQRHHRQLCRMSTSNGAFWN